MLGLTLGKYAPFHKGHDYILRTAKKEMDEVVVLVYDCPQVTNIPLTVRANWIRYYYPEMHVIEVRNPPTEEGYTDRIKKMHEDYVFEQLVLNGYNKNDFDAFYSSEPYGEHMSQALNCINRCVDEPRKGYPISGTIIRLMPYEYREFVPMYVYSSLVTKVLFMGAPSTGKTTLCKQLAENYNTKWVPEYGREYWEQHQVNRKLTPEQLFEIAYTQELDEDRLVYSADKYLFCDTSAITTYMFALDYGDVIDERLVNLANAACNRYDLVFVCDTDIPYDNTPERDGDEHRMRFQGMILDDLKIRKIPYFMLRGTLDERIAHVESVLEKFNKYDNLVDLVRRLES